MTYSKEKPSTFRLPREKKKTGRVAIDAAPPFRFRRAPPHGVVNSSRSAASRNRSS